MGSTRCQGRLQYGQAGLFLLSTRSLLVNIYELDTIEREKLGKTLLSWSGVQLGMAHTTGRKTERDLGPDFFGGFYIEDRASPTKSSESG